MVQNYARLNESDLRFIRKNNAKQIEKSTFKITDQQIKELEYSKPIKNNPDLNFNSLNNYSKTFRLLADDLLSDQLTSSSKYVVHRAVRTQLINNLQLTASTKTRSEVRGGGKKPWKQKGTGNARAGSNRSPLWRGGGVIFGPTPKNQFLKINKKEKDFAIKSILLNKREKWILIEDLHEILTKAKTNLFVSFLEQIKCSSEKKFLLLLTKEIPEIKKAAQNLKNVEVSSTNNINAISLLKADIIITPIDILNDLKFKGVFK